MRCYRRAHASNHRYWSCRPCAGYAAPDRNVRVLHDNDTVHSADTHMSAAEPQPAAAPTAAGNASILSHYIVGVNENTVC